MKIDGFPAGGTGSKVNGVGVVNHFLCGALTALQTMIAHLQPAASGPMTAEKQPTWTDDCCRRFSKSAAMCPSKEGPADNRLIMD